MTSKVIGAIVASLLSLFPDIALSEPLAPLQNEAKAWWMERLGGATGEIDPQGLANALDMRRNLLVDPQGKQGVRAKRAGLPALPTGWTNLSGYPQASGRINDLLIHPTTTNTMWAGADGGGIWKTTDGGATWAPVSDFLGSLSIANLVIDPNNASILYAATNPRSSQTYYPYGILKSTDGGVTWSQLAATDPSKNVDWRYVSRIAMHPTNGNILLAATEGGAYESTDQGATWTKVAGISNTATHVAIHPVNGNLRAIGYNDGTLRYTINGDLGGGGLTATVLAAGRSLRFAYAATEVSRLYALVTDSATDATRLLRSTNFGGAWTDITATVSNLPHPAYAQAGYAFFSNATSLSKTGALWVDPTNPDRLGVAEAWAMFTPNASAASISRFDLCDGLGDFHGIVAHPGYNGSTNKIVFFMDDGGLYKVTDVDQLTNSSRQCVAGVFSRLESGLTVSQVYSAAGRGGNSIFGAQDVSARAYRSDVPGGDSSNKWRYILRPVGDPVCSGCTWTGDGATTAASRASATTLYGSRPYLDLFRSTDGGVTGVSLTRGTAITEGQGIATPNKSASFIAPFVLDPSSQSRMYAGGNSLWRSSNVDTGSPPTWAAIKGALAEPACGNFAMPIQTIAVAPSDPNVVWITYACAGRVYKTVNALAATPTWTEVTTLPDAANLRTKSAIMIDGADPNIVWIGLGGYYASTLFKTTDGGASAAGWKAVAGLPSAPVNALLQHPTQNGWLYAGTGVGVFASADGGTTWSTSNEGPANVVVNSLAWYSEGPSGADILVGTFGRGVFRATVAPTVPDPPTITGIAIGNTQATITFSAPPSNGGSPITGYTATCNPGAFTASGAASPLTVTGLTNGTQYSCTVKATNTFGSSNASNAMTVTPAVIPVFTSAAATSFTVNAAATFTVTYTGGGTLTRTGALPSGVTFDAATGVLAGTAALGTVGSYPMTLTATNSAGTANQAFTLTVAKANQTITFGAISNRNFSTGAVALSATSSSTLAVAFTTLTSSVCTVSGNSFTMVGAGTCTIAANQAGDANYNAAAAVQQSFTVTAVVPDAPVITSASPGNAQAFIAFSAPPSNGGAPVSGYTVTCNPGAITGTGGTSPITVNGLANGTTYSCSVRATNSAGSSAASNALNVTPASALAPSITSANSATFVVTQGGSFTVTAIGVPGPALSRAGSLPTGITFDTASGVLSGTAPLGSVGSYPITFTATNASGSANQAFTLTVAKADQAITFAALANRSFNTAPFTVSATSSSGLAVSFSSLTGTVCSVSGNNVTMLGGGTCTVSASQAGDANFNAAPAVQQSFTISGGPLTGAPASLDFGGQSMQTTSPALNLTISNATGAAATVSTITASAGFGVTHNCAALANGASCVASVTFTPTAQGTVNGTLTVTHGGGSQTFALTGVGEKSLATHYYRSILRRAPDAAGKAFWESEATRAQALGVNVNETWYAMSLAFYGSAEYTAFNRDTNGFVTDLYNTFFNRTPDSGGLTYWTGQITQGMPREVVLASFMFSAEFAAFTQAIFGPSNVRPEINVVTDFYRGLLGRLPDTAGFSYWLTQFRFAQCQGGPQVNAQVEAISSAYATSEEYTGRSRSTAQYVGDLYNAFLRRGGDLAGVQFWIGQITSGARTREKVRQDFISQPEFQQRVQAVISQGCFQ